MFSAVQPGVAPQARVSNVHQQAASSPAQATFSFHSMAVAFRPEEMREILNPHKLSGVSTFDLVLVVATQLEGMGMLGKIAAKPLHPILRKLDGARYDGLYPSKAA